MVNGSVHFYDDKKMMVILTQIHWCFGVIFRKIIIFQVLIWEREGVMKFISLSSNSKMMKMLNHP